MFTEFEKLEYQLKEEIKDLQKEFEEKMESNNPANWFDYRICDNIEFNKKMLQRLYEFRESELDTFHKNQYDILTDND